MRRALAAALVALPFLGTGLAPARGGGPAPGALPPEAQALVEGHNAFALDLYAELREAKGNVLFSPYSIHTALAMARAGARGATAAEMDQVLHLPAGDLGAAWKALVRHVTTAPQASMRVGGGRREVPAYSVSVANALWGQKGYPFVPAYRALVRDAFGAELADVDFAQGPVVREQINDWVLGRTNQKIQDLIQGPLNPDTRLLLVNAIHFLAEWEEPFQKDLTEPHEFITAQGTQVSVQMMKRTDRFRTFEDGDARVLAIPYKGRAAEMLLVLPKDPAGLEALEKGLTPERVAAWGTRQEAALADLQLPRFTFEAPTPLGALLEGMGMSAAFSATTPDSRGMADVPGEPLYIGGVLHKAFIAVDEKGTEAAAATAVEMRGGSAEDPEEPVPFVCDRPFLFFLRHTGTGALLFAGRLAAPQPQ